MLAPAFADFLPQPKIVPSPTATCPTGRAKAPSLNCPKVPASRPTAASAETSITCPTRAASAAAPADLPSLMQTIIRSATSATGSVKAPSRRSPPQDLLCATAAVCARRVHHENADPARRGAKGVPKRARDRRVPNVSPPPPRWTHSGGRR